MSRSPNCIWRGLLPCELTTPKFEAPAVGSRNGSKKTGWLKTLVTTYSNCVLKRSVILMFFTKRMSTFQYIKPRIAPTPPVPLSKPRIGLRVVLKRPAGSAKMLNAASPALLWSEDPDGCAPVKMHCSLSKKLAASAPPKDWPLVFVPQYTGAPLPMANTGDKDQPPARRPMKPC